MELNGVAMGEFGCRAPFAGSMGVPTLFVSGDDKMAAEARALVPEIVTAEVKVGMHRSWRSIWRRPMRAN